MFKNIFTFSEIYSKFNLLLYGLLNIDSLLREKEWMHLEKRKRKRKRKLLIG